MLDVLMVFLLIVLPVGILIGLPIWMIWDHKTNPFWHRTFCTCQRCNEDSLRRKVEREEWTKREREQQAAVDELFRDRRYRP